MKAVSNLFVGGIFAFAPVAIIYALWSRFEPVGSVGMGLLAVMSGMIGFYLRATVRKLDTSPSDRGDALIEESAGDYGFFSPHSWWPFMLALSAALLFLGLAVGWWIFLVGVILGALSLIGWSFEYFRGAVL